MQIRPQTQGSFESQGKYSHGLYISGQGGSGTMIPGMHILLSLSFLHVVCLIGCCVQQCHVCPPLCARLSDIRFASFFRVVLPTPTLQTRMPRPSLR